MKLRVSYREDRSQAAGAPAAHRWTEEVESDDFIATVKELMDDAARAGRTISQILVQEHELQSV
jgi:hypothetical protein